MILTIDAAVINAIIAKTKDMGPIPFFSSDEERESVVLKSFTFPETMVVKPEDLMPDDPESIL